MTVRPIYSVWCDAKSGCGNWIGSSDTPNKSRAEAKRAGWTRKKKNGFLVDLCPEHSVKEDSKEQRREDIMIFLNGSKTSFRCECGCNVFTKKPNNNKYVCNSCDTKYTGE